MRHADDVTGLNMQSVRLGNRRVFSPPYTSIKRRRCYLQTQIRISLRPAVVPSLELNVSHLRLQKPTCRAYSFLNHQQTTLYPEKVVYHTHIDNLVNSQRIFKILSLMADSLENLRRNYQHTVYTVVPFLPIMRHHNAPRFSFVVLCLIMCISVKCILVGY